MKSKVTVRHISHPPVVELPVLRLTLELTRKEAMALMTLTRYIGGNPSGPRGLFETIRDNLDEAGIESDDTLIDKSKTTRIIFAD